MRIVQDMRNMRSDCYSVRVLMESPWRSSNPGKASCVGTDGQQLSQEVSEGKYLAHGWAR